jgi:4-aminobutyrate aminotransferase
MAKAVQDADEKFLHISSDFYYEGWVRLSEKLDENAPFQENVRTFLTNSDTELVETAIRLVGSYKRSYILPLSNSGPWH